MKSAFQRHPVQKKKKKCSPPVPAPPPGAKKKKKEKKKRKKSEGGGKPSLRVGYLCRFYAHTQIIKKKKFFL